MGDLFLPERPHIHIHVHIHIHIHIHEYEHIDKHVDKHIHFNIRQHNYVHIDLRHQFALAAVTCPDSLTCRSFVHLQQHNKHHGGPAYHDHGCNDSDINKHKHYDINHHDAFVHGEHEL